MTTENDELEDRILKSGKSAEKQNVFPTGFQDPSGLYPRADYFYKSSLNMASLGTKRNDLTTNGGIPTLQKEDVYQDKIIRDAKAAGQYNSATASTYPHNQVIETPGGHIIEMDDTIGNERMLIHHKSGSGIEIKPDGTVYISSGKDLLISAADDAHIVVEGNTHMTHQGNLNVDVTGDYNLNVAGNYNKFIAGDERADIDGARRYNIEKNDGLIVKGGKFTTVAKGVVDTYLGGFTAAVKGAWATSVEGACNLFSSDEMRMTSEVRQNLTSPDTNIAANELSVFGDKGTFGGKNVTLYSYNAHIGNTVWLGDGSPGTAGTLAVDTITATRVEVTGDIVASNSVTSPTFHGDLDGVAEEARQSRHQLYSDPDTGPGSGGNVGSPGAPITNNAIDTDILAHDTGHTALPDGELMQAYQKSSYGIQKVLVDPNGDLLGAIDRTGSTGGIASRQLTTSEARSKMRDNGTLNNTDFMAVQVGEGKIAGDYTKATPGKVGRTVGPEYTPQENHRHIGVQ
jgi:hypothetical protein